jgi:hypothetical protein
MGGAGNGAEPGQRHRLLQSRLLLRDGRRDRAGARMPREADRGRRATASVGRQRPGFRPHPRRSPFPGAGGPPERRSAGLPANGIDAQA